jgi:phosphoglucosamine mutase
VVSASHNPAEFNGIKFFTARGFKASEKTEAAIEAGMARPRDAGPVRSPRIERDPRAAGDYLDFLRSTFPAAEDLSGLRLVVDSAHGAASGLAGELLRSLGAEVFEMGCSPDGGNINRGCGALATEAMRAEVVRRKAFCGVSLDGDSDRALFSDERGRLMNGDLVIALCALHLRRKGLLAGGKVVLTVMSNFGLRRFLEESGIGVVEVPVGDRNVTDAIEAGGYPLGGEQSGHVVFRRFSPTGDGLLTALQTLAVFVEAGGPASRFRRLYRDYPQVLRNLRVERRVPIEGLPGFQRALRLAEEPLRGRGRVFVRYSGTEPLLRILVEGPDKGEVRRISEDLARSFVESASEALERGN